MCKAPRTNVQGNHPQQKSHKFKVTIFKKISQVKRVQQRRHSLYLSKARGVCPRATVQGKPSSTKISQVQRTTWSLAIFLLRMVALDICVWVEPPLALHTLPPPPTSALVHGPPRLDIQGTKGVKLRVRGYQCCSAIHLMRDRCCHVTHSVAKTPSQRPPKLFSPLTFHSTLPHPPPKK